MTLQDYEMLLKTMEMLNTRTLLDAEMLLRKLATVSRGEDAMLISSDIKVVGITTDEPGFPVEKYVYDEIVDTSDLGGTKYDLAVAIKDAIPLIKRLIPHTNFLLMDRQGLPEVDAKYYAKGMTLSLGAKEYILLDLR